MVTSLGHVGIVCDDFLKMRDFYTRVIGLTVTDEDPERGGCFLSGDPDTEHHQLALGKVREGRPKTANVGQISFIVDSMDSLKKLYRRVVDEGMKIDHVVTHGQLMVLGVRVAAEKAAAPPRGSLIFGDALTPALSQRERGPSPFPLDGGRLGWG